jgi:hypothetical protein
LGDETPVQGKQLYLKFSVRDPEFAVMDPVQKAWIEHGAYGGLMQWKT